MANTENCRLFVFRFVLDIVINAKHSSDEILFAFDLLCTLVKSLALANHKQQRLSKGNEPVILWSPLVKPSSI